jgi:hypothetical protein
VCGPVEVVVLKTDLEDGVEVAVVEEDGTED